MEIIDCDQGTEEWLQARLGFVTASNFATVRSKGSGRDTYMWRLAGERDSGELAPKSYTNSNMKRGNELEAEAREFYECNRLRQVEQVGFVQRDNDVGGSPDGLVGEDGIIEIKCPLNATHLKTIRYGKMDTKYIPQVQGLLWITGRQWCDFISYAPSATTPMFVIRIERDAKYIAELAGKVGLFVSELKENLAEIDIGF